jgi:hypothetical protein
MIEYEKLGYIQGWIEPQVIPILQYINYMQTDISGNIVEIGVHHGKSFVVLASLLKQDEIAFAVDIFEDQSQNVSHSGNGNMAAFATVVSTHLPQARVTIIKDNSMDLPPKALLYNGRGTRIFSVDGGHSAHEVENDLLLAKDVLCDGGVIIVDDFQHIGWDGVFEATVKFLDDGQFVPIAMGGNKLFLSRKAAAEERYSTIPSLTTEEYFATVVDNATLKKADYIATKFPTTALFREQQHIFDRIQNGITEG